MYVKQSEMQYCTGDMAGSQADRDAAWEAGVTSTPAVIFYWEGRPAVIHRPGWEVDNKLKAIPNDKLSEVIRHARDCCTKCESDGSPLVINFDY